jgi:2-polyprenyl-6-methoxyphenol hydroxylase-like FAD-dependent oxidoreductase
MSRPFLEWTIRNRLAASPAVSIRGEVAAEGLDFDPGRGRVAAVRLADGDRLACELVVDATGRQARSINWLTALGYPEPDVSRVEVDTRYVTQEFRRTDLPRRDWKMAGVIDDPATKRLAMALPIEDDRWLVLFGGLHGEVAPLDDDQRLAYARSLPSPVIADVMEASEPLGPPVTHRFPSSQRRYVERLKRYPLGWVLIGDAIGSFNPIYGQGMTSAALQADALGAALDRSRAVDHSFSRHYCNAAGSVVNVAWSTAVGSDFAYADTTGPKPAGTDLVNRYVNRVIVAAQHDDDVALRFNEVVAMVRKPEALFTPRIVYRVFRAPRRAVGASESASSTTTR